MRKVIFQGQTWYSVGDAARYLGTTAQKIRVFMGDGSLNYTQVRRNGNLYVSAEDLVKLKGAEPEPSKPKRR